MLLKSKIALIHGGGGAVGSAVAKTFAREGAKVFLSGRNAGPVEAVAESIIAAGGDAESSSVDALDEDAVEQHAARIVSKAGRIDVVLNAIGFRTVQGNSTDRDKLRQLYHSDCNLDEDAVPDGARGRAIYGAEAFRSHSDALSFAGAVGDCLDRRIWCRVRGS